jgi:acyl carrier protein phosphodiesterase
MNFLAHLYLSGDDDKVMVGNFIGDFIKGRNLNERFENRIVTGIELHRSIDDFTDNHPVVVESKAKLRSKYRHYSAVITDMYYDHFLARHWSKFHPLPLSDYTHQAYAVLMKYDAVLPEEVRYMLTYMMRDNWLVGYGTLDGIHRALSGIARRTSFPSKMEEAANDLRNNYASFEKDFLLFFPDLKSHADLFLTSNPI